MEWNDCASLVACSIYLKIGRVIIIIIQEFEFYWEPKLSFIKCSQNHVCAKAWVFTRVMRLFCSSFIIWISSDSSTSKTHIEAAHMCHEFWGQNYHTIFMQPIMTAFLELHLRNESVIIAIFRVDYLIQRGTFWSEIGGKESAVTWVHGFGLAELQVPAIRQSWANLE